VLVVDDNTDAADSVAILLGAAGYDVRVGYSAKSALQTAVEYQPDIVLLDIGLPEMDGYELAQLLRQQAGLTDTKLIALTGYGQDADRQRSQESEFGYHLVKPVDSGTLQELLESLMKRDSK
jgi:CheY-like chemotaxis protein